MHRAVMAVRADADVALVASCARPCVSLRRGGAWAIAATGRNGDQGAEAHRDILVDHCSSFEASLSTLVSRTSALCASHAELKMNVGFSRRSPRVGAQYCRMRRLSAAATNHAPIEDTRKFASLPISASCGVDAGNIILPLSISPLHVVSQGLGQSQAAIRRARPNRERIGSGDDAIMTAGADR